MTRVLGTRERVVPELKTVEVGVGDLFLLCSDGLTDCVSDDELTRVLAGVEADELHEVPKQLITLANPTEVANTMAMTKKERLISEAVISCDSVLCACISEIIVDNVWSI